MKHRVQTVHSANQ